MFLKSVSFDSKSPYWMDDQAYIYKFLRMAERYVNETIRHRGYMYLNQICEQLGVGWNPEDGNACIKNDNVDRIEFVQFETFSQPDNSFLIHIYCYE